MNKITIPIKGMHCRSCEILISENLQELEGVEHASANFKKGQAVISFQGKRPSDSSLRQAIQNAGYDIGQPGKYPLISKRPSDYVTLLNAIVLVLVLFLAADMSDLLSFQVASQRASMGVVILVGLVAGFSSCMALIGGLVLAFSVRHGELHPEATRMQKFRPHLFFNAGRILGFAALGGLLGLFGSIFKLSSSVLATLTILVGVVMILLGLKLIEIFPIFQKVSLTLPTSLARLLGIKKETKEYSHTSVFFAGVITFFLPCGFTQSMQLLAIASGSFMQGLLIMALFALGTAPGLLGIGGLSSLFKGKAAKLFFAAAGVTVIALGIFNINNARKVLFISSPSSPVQEQPLAGGDVQEVRMTQTAFGYKPNTFTIKAGQKVRWIINSTSSYSCASSIIVPQYGIQKDLNPGQNTIEFTPQKTGEIGFSCSMGMYRGKFIVQEN